MEKKHFCTKVRAVALRMFKCIRHKFSNYNPLDTDAHTQTNAKQSNGERVKSLLFCETHRENVRFFFILQE